MLPYEEERRWRASAGRGWAGQSVGWARQIRREKGEERRIKTERKEKEKKKKKIAMRNLRSLLLLEAFLM